MQKLTHYTRRRADRHFRIFSNSPNPHPRVYFSCPSHEGFDERDITAEIKEGLKKV